MFRLLGVHPGPDISVLAAASLAGVPRRSARAALSELTNANLLAHQIAGRFAFHDLLRAYAAELTHSVEFPDERDDAVHRVLDHYLHTAQTAATLLYSRWAPCPITDDVDPGVTLPDLMDYKAAWEWLTAEYPALFAATELALATEHYTHAWRLPCLMEEFFARSGRWHDWIANQRIALTAAQRGDDPQGQAHAHRSLGRAYPWLGQFEVSHAHLRQALSLFEGLDDTSGLAAAHVELAWTLALQNRHVDAINHTTHAFTLSQIAGNLSGQAKTLEDTGWFHALLGEHAKALHYSHQAVIIYRELGDRRGEGHTLHNIAYAHHHLGRHQLAIAYFQQSLAIRREHRDLYGQAAILTHLGDTWQACGDVHAARDSWLQALQIFDQLGAVRHPSLGLPDIGEVRAKLRDIPSHHEK